MICSSRIDVDIHISYYILTNFKITIARSLVQFKDQPKLTLYIQIKDLIFRKMLCQFVRKNELKRIEVWFDNYIFLHLISFVYFRQKHCDVYIRFFIFFVKVC